MLQSRKRQANDDGSAKPAAKRPGESSAAATLASREGGSRAEGRKKRALDVNAAAPTQPPANHKPPAQAAAGNDTKSGGGPMTSSSPPVFNEVKLPGLSPSAANRGNPKEAAKTERPSSADEVGQHHLQDCTCWKLARTSYLERALRVPWY